MQQRFIRTAALLQYLMAAIILAGCSAGSVSGVTQRFMVRPTATPAAVAPSTPANRVLVQGPDGNLYLVRPDGKERFALTNDASAERYYSQAAWSADGNHIAWSRLDEKGAALVTSRFDGSTQKVIDLPFLPFYIAWSPTARQLAYLSNWERASEPSIALRLVDVNEDGNQVKTLTSGEPLYFSWSPNGEQLLTHIGNERVELQPLGGDARSLVISTGSFPTPQWSPDGETLVYATVDEAGSHLVITDLEGEPVTEVTFDQRITFQQSPDGRQVAYVLTDADRQASTFGPLYVADKENLRTRELTEFPVIAFSWSPDAQKLAYLTLETVDERMVTRWNVWDGNQRTAYSAFLPSRTSLEEYLPFFDQYAQSHRIWSPDSSAFVFSGSLVTGGRGVWVQSLDTDGGPINIGPGVVAAWSPQ